MAISSDLNFTDATSDATTSVLVPDWPSFRAIQRDAESGVIRATSSPRNQLFTLSFSSNDFPLYDSTVPEGNRVPGVVSGRDVYVRLNAQYRVEDTGTFLGYMPLQVSVRLKLPIADEFDATNITELHQIIGGLFYMMSGGSPVSVLPDFLIGGTMPEGIIG